MPMPDSAHPAPPVFLARSVAAPLDRYVACLWMASGRADYQRYRVLPNGVTEVIFNLGADLHGVVDASDPRRVENFRDSWVAGIQHRYLTVESLGDGDLIAIRFLPGGARWFFGIPLTELTDRVFELDLVLGRMVRELRERLLLHPDAASRFTELERFLCSRLGAAPDIDRAVQFLCGRLRATAGQARIGALVESTGLSHKRLLQRFQATVGMTPKSLARIYRFQSALASIGGAKRVEWTHVAAACGYSDQSHFNHDFRAFTGLTPSGYLDLRSPDPNQTIERSGEIFSKSTDPDAS